MYFSEIGNPIRFFCQRLGCISAPAPLINTITVPELKHAGFCLVLEEATVTSVSDYWHVLYFLPEVPTAMIVLCLSCSISLDSIWTSPPERDLLWLTRLFFCGGGVTLFLTIHHPSPFLYISSSLKRSHCSIFILVIFWFAHWNLISLQLHISLVLWRAEKACWLWKHLINICWMIK